MVVRGAVRSVLSDKLAAKHLVILDSLELSAAKTKALAETLTKTFKLRPRPAGRFWKRMQTASAGARNIAKVNYVPTEGVNTYDLVKHDWLFISKASVEALVAKLAEVGGVGL